MADKRSAPKLSKHCVKKEWQAIFLKTKMEVTQKIEDGQTRPNVCRSLNLPPSTVTTFIQSADRIKRPMQQSTAVNATEGKFLEKWKNNYRYRWMMQIKKTFY